MGGKGQKRPATATSGNKKSLPLAKGKVVEDRMRLFGASPPGALILTANCLTANSSIPCAEDGGKNAVEPADDALEEADVHAAAPGADVVGLGLRISFF